MAKKADWDQRYLEMSRLVSAWSKDSNAKVGAVIVRGNRVVATGFNGFPANVQDDDRLSDKVMKQAMVVHAEENALLSAGDRARGATLYVFGKPVCARCAASIIQSGIVRVVAPAPAAQSAEVAKEVRPGYIDWDWMGRVADDLFAEAGIQVHHRCLPAREVRSDMKSKPANDRGEPERVAKVK